MNEVFSGTYLLSPRGTASLPEIDHHTPRPLVSSHHQRAEFQPILVDSKSERSANDRKMQFQQQCKNDGKSAIMQRDSISAVKTLR